MLELKKKNLFSLINCISNEKFLTKLDKRLELNNFEIEGQN